VWSVGLMKTDCGPARARAYHVVVLIHVCCA
jgi:hypothetical protein